MSGSTILSFDEVSYEHDSKKPILREASFSVRRGAKLALMGQNGAGKSTLFGLITGRYSPDEGEIHITDNASISISRQVIPRDEMQLPLRVFFEQCFPDKVYNIDPRIDAVLEVVNMAPPAEIKEIFRERIVSSFSGGQQARLLLAQALITNPDVLLLDEPTNNLDTAGIDHLTKFLKEYKKTVIVISHDSDFLNAFTEGVLYLNVQERIIEKYHGDYNNVVSEIAVRVEKERRKNSQAEKEIQANKDKANKFANKGGNMRAIAKQMREKVADYEANKIEVRKDDKTIRPFTIPVQGCAPLRIMKLRSYRVIRDHKPIDVECNLEFQRNKRWRLIGPNGIGKTTLLESLASGTNDGGEIHQGVIVGYYRQDFSNLDFEQTVHDCLMSVMGRRSQEEMRSVAAGFLITGEIIHTQIGLLSEGQKGLVAFARLVLLGPGLLILDEPTNHINFRHIPVIAQALDQYQGAMILVSHVDEFVDQIRVDEYLDLGKSPK